MLKTTAIEAGNKISSVEPVNFETDYVGYQDWQGRNPFSIMLRKEPDEDLTVAIWKVNKTNKVKP